VPKNECGFTLSIYGVNKKHDGLSLDFSSGCGQSTTTCPKLVQGRARDFAERQENRKVFADFASLGRRVAANRRNSGCENAVNAAPDLEFGGANRE